MALYLQRADPVNERPPAAVYRCQTYVDKTAAMPYLDAWETTMDFLKKLCEAPGVSGYEDAVQEIVRQELLY